MKLEHVVGGVTAAEGFLAGGVSCGIKKRGKDCALIFSQYPAVIAGTLTRNLMQAPSVVWAKKILKQGTARAVIANSGNANCCTGARGAADNERIAIHAAHRLKVKPTEVLVGSTGVIGRFLPMKKMRAGITAVVRNLTRTGSLAAAEAIMTTDTRPKEIAVRFRAGGASITVGGIAKGAGMVCPSMATMFGFLTTDVRINRFVLSRVLRVVVADTFNAMTIDGEMSTNDMVLFLANGAAHSPEVRPGNLLYRYFVSAVREVCEYLAHEIVRDGEGVTRTFRVEVMGAGTRKDAEKIGRQIGNSSLVKTMVAGRDPNWGRIAAALGASGVSIDAKRLKIVLGKTIVFQKGEPVSAQHGTLLHEVDQPEVQIKIDLGQGSSSAHILSGDLTEGYIRINAKYTT